MNTDRKLDVGPKRSIGSASMNTFGKAPPPGWRMPSRDGHGGVAGYGNPMA